MRAVIVCGFLTLAALLAASVLLSPTSWGDE